MSMSTPSQTVEAATSLVFESPSDSTSTHSRDDDYGAYQDPLSSEEDHDDAALRTSADSCSSSNNSRGPVGIAVAAAAVSAAAVLALIERRHQARLEQELPLLFTSGHTNNMHPEDPTAASTFRIRRPMRPQFLIGTRGKLSSIAAFLQRGPRNLAPVHNEHVVIPNDGATVGLHWYCNTSTVRKEWIIRSTEKSKEALRHIPTVLILHGINNHSGFGYIQKTVAACLRCGWIAVAMDFRGSRPDMPLTTPRIYTAAYTNDIRAIIHVLYHQRGCKTLLAVGNSLGANILVKYLGEEGSHCTLKAAVTFSNPVSIDSRDADAFHSPVIAAGIKFNGLLHQRHSLRPTLHRDPTWRATWHNLWWKTWTLADVDRALCLLFPRSDPIDHGTAPLGYADSTDYWHEASSFRYMHNIRIPLLHVTAADDTLVRDAVRRTLRYCLAEPTITVVETPCGGHLGWQECDRDQDGCSMYAADVLMVDYFQSVLLQDGGSTIPLPTPISKL